MSLSSVNVVAPRGRLIASSTPGIPAARLARRSWCAAAAALLCFGLGAASPAAGSAASPAAGSAASPAASSAAGSAASAAAGTATTNRTGSAGAAVGSAAGAAAGAAAAASTGGTAAESADSPAAGRPAPAGRPAAALPQVPLHLPPPDASGQVLIPNASGALKATTIDPMLQDHLASYIADSGSPIAGIVVADAHTGEILAMAQGRPPESWGGKTHTALHPSFPAASVFKTVVTTAAFEVADLDGDLALGLTGGCSHVRETGDWLNDRALNDLGRMTLRTAFGHSCNGFFAKIGVNELGIGIITSFAKRYGWGEPGVPADFRMEHDPFYPPSPENSSTHTVGRFAAGFGVVGLSAAHAAYIMLAIANRGLALPLKIFKDTPAQPVASRQRVFSDATADKLNQILSASVRGGTASFAFRRGKYRKLHELVGGKTGTLTGGAPRGLTTWFAGLAPIDNPQVVVAAVVVLDERWHIKGPNLAAEGFWAYFDEQLNSKAMAARSRRHIAAYRTSKKAD